ncbi:MAG: phosphate transport system protein [Chloroflexi bacterium]|nr:MAG: phosphate transport system protein [Chloroflexota bacterium]MBA4375501.1 phosphate transport system regulatory protein PhoU [Anaerolinea sp.]
MSRDNLMLQIHQVQDELLLMGSMVEQATIKSIEALKNRDREAAKTIYNADRLVNEKRYAIENSVLILIATQQPLAHDLRLLAALLEIAAEIERMGDYAKGIAKVVINLEDVDIPIPFKEIEEMASLAVSMFHRALGAFVLEDALTAKKIPPEDDKVDELYNQVQRHIVHIMIEKPEIIDHANLLMWVAHNLERMADRVSNICERTIFVATGELMEIESKKKEIQ